MDERTITDKNEVVALVKDYLKENSLCDLTDIVAKNCDGDHQVSTYVRDIAHKMRKTGNYDFKEKFNGESVTYYIYEIPRPPFVERRWYIVALFSVVLGAMLSTGLDIAKQKILQPTTPIYQIDLSRSDFYRSLDTMRKQIELLKINESERNDSALNTQIK